MTKHIRISNADTSDFKVLVKVQVKSDGKWIDTNESHDLGCPGYALDQTIWEGKRLIIEEVGVLDYHWVQKVK